MPNLFSTVGCSLEAFMASSSTMNAGPQVEEFQVVSCSGPLGPVSELHGIFNASWEVTNGNVAFLNFT